MIATNDGLAVNSYRYNTWEPDENIIDRRLIETFLEERFDLWRYFNHFLPRDAMLARY